MLLISRWAGVLANNIAEKGTKRARNVPFLRPQWFQLNPSNSFRKNGGDDETRTRDLCRDSLGIHVLSATYILAGAGKSLKRTVGPKSGVKFVIFLQIGPKIVPCSQNLCSSRSNFTTVASAFQRFQPVNSTQYLLGLLGNEGRVD